MTSADSECKMILRTGSFDPQIKWNTLVWLHPVDDADNMSEEDRTVAICLETYDGQLHNFRGSATFDRFADTAFYRFMLSVFRVKNANVSNGAVTETLGDAIERLEIRLTNRFKWHTQEKKVKGTTTSGRWVSIFFDRDVEEQTPESIKQLDIIIPRSTTSDNGKLLALAVEAARLVVDASLAMKTFEEAAKRVR